MFASRVASANLTLSNSLTQRSRYVGDANHSGLMQFRLNANIRSRHSSSSRWHPSAIDFKSFTPPPKYIRIPLNPFTVKSDLVSGVDNAAHVACPSRQTGRCSKNTPWKQFQHKISCRQWANTCHPFVS